MTTLETETGTTGQILNIASTSAPVAEHPATTAALITEQQVLFASAAALAPTPAHHHHFAHDFASAVRAMFTWPERSHEHKHYPQRFSYLESAAMSREMYRL
jgi:hypothetical protein